MVLQRQHPQSEDEFMLLTALADGSLAPGRRPELHKLMAATPALSDTFRQQRFAIDAVRAVTTPAPARLRARVDAQHRRASERATGARKRAFAGGFGSVAAAAVLVAALLVSGGEGTGPTVKEVAALNPAGSLEPAPEADPRRPTTLRHDAAGLPFPNLADKFGWRAVGTRAERVDGREAETVVYEKGGRRLAYTIVAGEALTSPSEARSATRAGVSFDVFAGYGERAVTWLRRGQTCVLSGRDTSMAELIQLASWTGKGTIPT
jgi:hypothetical protein